MSKTKRWDIAETCKHIENRFGSNQLTLAKPSLYSLSDRLDYARYHFQEVLALFETFKSIHLTKKPLFIIRLGSEEEREDFDIFATKSGANSVACVQSIHSIPDLLAHAIYFSLGMNLHPNAINERKVSSFNVIKFLQENSVYPSLGVALSQFSNHDDFKHIAALSNKAKHQGIVKQQLHEDFEGTKKNRHELRFGAFEYSKICFQETPITDLLESSYALASNVIIEVGNEINKLYKTNAV